MRKLNNVVRALALLLCIIICGGVLTSCNINGGVIKVKDTDKSDISSLNNPTSLLAATDDLGRTVTLEKDYDDTKSVGIFYTLWLGAAGADELHDVSKIMAKDPNAANDSVLWLKAGGGTKGSRHWWGESIFGYYFSVDKWVAERDVMMLTNAGIDFLCIDYSNGNEYEDALFVLLKALDKYYKQGYNVPQITFVTKAKGGKITQSLYENLYMSHPEYGHLWYQMDGKPFIIANEGDLEISDEAREYFSFRFPQWPREEYHENGFPWMDFKFPQQIYGNAESKRIISVTVNQHCGTLANSSSAFYGDDTNHTRSWHNGANDKRKDAWLYGFNFAEQFENAISQDPDIIFITGWNEWIATRQSNWSGIDGQPVDDPVVLVDNCDINNSRDIMPMKGGYGDNYYMQMIDYIRKFKGTRPVNISLNTNAKNEKKTVDIKGSIQQWQDIKPFYLDYIEDIENRRGVGYGATVYKNDTGRNDIYKIKMANDGENLYYYVRTVGEIKDFDKEHCLSMFLSTGSKNNWNGYDYVINRNAAGSDKMVIEKRNAKGWEKLGEVEYSKSGCELMVKVPLNLFKGNLVQIKFKCADNYKDDDFYSFYTDGDCAPYGRLNYVYNICK